MPNLDLRRKDDLSGATLDDVEQKSLVEICVGFETKVELVRRRKDPALEESRGMFRAVPFFALNLELRRAGIHASMDHPLDHFDKLD